MATAILKWHSVTHWLFKIGAAIINWLKIQFLKDSILGSLFQEIGHYITYRLHVQPELATVEGPVYPLRVPKLSAVKNKKKKKKKGN